MVNRSMGMMGVLAVLMVGCQARGVGSTSRSADQQDATGPEPQASPASGAERAPAVRHPSVAGSFYPAQASRLRAMVTRFLAHVPDLNPGGTIVAAMAPHAGYGYSGQVAAYTHKLIRDVPFDTIVIIGHDAFRGGVAYPCSVDDFETPLGRVPVDREMVAALEARHPGIQDRCEFQDHTVEVQLPFLQVTRKKFKIVPMLFGDPTPENARILADAIRATAGHRKVFVLASTDMSHYPGYDDARKLDLATLDVLKQLDPKRLFDHLVRARRSGMPGLRTAMCASGGVLTAMMVARAEGADQVTVLKYANAGDVPQGDKSRVVGYGAALFVRSGGAAGEAGKE